jgi:two-component system OmpR family response regulator
MTPEKPHLLIVDDDRNIREPLARFLQSNAFDVSIADSAAAARQVMASAKIDLIVLDVMMRGEDGLAFCRQIRQSGSLPVVFISALTSEVDRILGIEMGGDDYLAKPFSPRELLARVRAVLRRAGTGHTGPPPAGRRWRFGDWTLNGPERELVRSDGLVVSLATTEYKLLMAFLERPQMVFSREQLLERMHGEASSTFDRAVDTQISRLRAKLGDDAREPRLIKTAWGAGYVLSAEVHRL